MGYDTLYWLSALVFATELPAAATTIDQNLFPNTFDWRSLNGTNWLDCCGAEVRDQRPAPPRSWFPPEQEPCDACWAFSSMDVMSARIFIKSQGTVRALPATNFLFDCMPGLKHCGYPGDASQVRIDTRAHILIGYIWIAVIELLHGVPCLNLSLVVFLAALTLQQGNGRTPLSINRPIPVPLPLTGLQFSNKNWSA